MSDGEVPEPGWYPDPADASVARWWDGSRWSDLRQSVPVAAAEAESTDGAAAAVVILPDEPQPTGSSDRSKWPIVLLVACVVVIGAALVLYPRIGSVGGQQADSGSTAPVAVPVAQVCRDTAEALTADGTAGTLIARLTSTADGVDLSTAGEFYASIGEQSASVLTSTGAACLQAVAASQAPVGYSTFVTAFNRALEDGSAIGASASEGKGSLTAEQIATLRNDAKALADAQTVVAANAPAVPTVAPVG
ncbi:MAG: DUF2510 domain-containing protein [Actinomycetes bacterium]